MRKILRCLFLVILVVCLDSCSKKNSSPKTDESTVKNPPYNDFNAKSQIPKKTATRFVEGVVVGTVAGSIMSSPAPVLGGMIGGAVGGVATAVQTQKEESVEHMINLLQNDDHIQVIQEDGLITLLIPTDPYYLYASYELDDTSYPGLTHVAQLVVRHSDNETIYVAGFSDSDIGSERQEQKLSYERARTMADFLWANGVPLNRLVIQGYGNRYNIADNDLIHGATMNRRVEVQWKFP